jgi:hypothetical protein
MGFRRAIIPRTDRDELPAKEIIEVVTVRTLAEALEVAFA